MVGVPGLADEGPDLVFDGRRGFDGEHDHRAAEPGVLEDLQGGGRGEARAAAGGVVADDDQVGVDLPQAFAGLLRGAGGGDAEAAPDEGEGDDALLGLGGGEAEDVGVDLGGGPAGAEDLGRPARAGREEFEGELFFGAVAADVAAFADEAAPGGPGPDLVGRAAVEGGEDDAADGVAVEERGLAEGEAVEADVVPVGGEGDVVGTRARGGHPDTLDLPGDPVFGAPISSVTLAHVPAQRRRCRGIGPRGEALCRNGTSSCAGAAGGAGRTGREPFPGGDGPVTPRRFGRRLRSGGERGIRNSGSGRGTWKGRPSGSTRSCGRVPRGAGWWAPTRGAGGRG